MAARKERDQSSFHQFALTNKDFADLIANRFKQPSSCGITTDNGLSRHVHDGSLLLRRFVERVNGSIQIDGLQKTPVTAGAGSLGSMVGPIDAAAAVAAMPPV